MYQLKLRGWQLCVGACFGMLLVITPVGAQAPQATQNPPNSNSHTSHPIDWKPGPMTARLGDSAEIQIPNGYLFADGDGARKYLELAHNPVSNHEVGVIAPRSEAESWFVIFEFDEVGFVKDDEGSSLDPKALLESIQNGTEEANETRNKNGWAAFHVTGWYTPPFYNQTTHNLTWAINGQEDNAANKSVNYSVRILGRRGTMNVDLILDPQEVDKTVPVFNSLMENFHFVEGHRYADFVKGDKLAGYGLAALIGGGTTAVLVKTGLLGKLWKVIVTLLVAGWKFIAIFFAAVAARFRQIWGWFSGLFRRKEAKLDPEPEFPSSNAQLGSGTISQENTSQEVGVGGSDPHDHAGD